MPVYTAGYYVDVPYRGKDEFVGPGISQIDLNECTTDESLEGRIKNFVKIDAPVLITGETGTGKELVARAIHERGRWNNEPFLPINAGGIPPDHLYTELFGHEKGAFTDARIARLGAFIDAGRGTIFLDEIGELSAEGQIKLLRVVQEKKIRHLMSTQEVPVNCRIITATNKDLSAEVAKGNFREDLYHRLNVFRINVPPLRQRRGDIPVLVSYFLNKFRKEFHDAQNVDSVPVVSGGNTILLSHLEWFGNARELHNNILRYAASGEPLSIVPHEFRKFPDMVRDTLCPQNRRGYFIDEFLRTVAFQYMDETKQIISGESEGKADHFQLQTKALEMLRISEDEHRALSRYGQNRNLSLRHEDTARRQLYKEYANHQNTLGYVLTRFAAACFGCLAEDRVPYLVPKLPVKGQYTKVNKLSFEAVLSQAYDTLATRIPRQKVDAIVRSDGEIILADVFQLHRTPYTPWRHKENQPNNSSHPSRFRRENRR